MLKIIIVGSFITVWDAHSPFFSENLKAKIFLPHAKSQILMLGITGTQHPTITSDKSQDLVLSLSFLKLV